jgi:hypothetical protein
VILGRPKKLRRRGVNESRDPKNPNKMRKYRARMICEKCTGLGHNKRSCPLNKMLASVSVTEPYYCRVIFQMD